MSITAVQDESGILYLSYDQLRSIIKAEIKELSDSDVPIEDIDKCNDEELEDWYSAIQYSKRH